MRRHLFRDRSPASQTLAQFRRTAHDEQFVILAYCLMPDHLHVLVEGLSDGSDLRRFVRMAKQRAAHWHAQSGRGRLWQEGYHDRVLRRDDDVLDVARYIFENPVRAGLAVSPDDYEHCGSDVWTVAEVLAACADRRSIR